jgi:hypothetical protein
MNEEGETSSTPVPCEADDLDRKVASDDFELQMLLALNEAPSQLRTDDPAHPLYNARHGRMIFDVLGPLLREAGFEPADRVLLHKLLFTWKDGSAACKQLLTYAYARMIAYSRLLDQHYREFEAREDYTNEVRAGAILWLVAQARLAFRFVAPQPAHKSIQQSDLRVDTQFWSPSM